jgi:hypothetical protein
VTPVVNVPRTGNRRSTNRSPTMKKNLVIAGLAIVALLESVFIAVAILKPSNEGSSDSPGEPVVFRIHAPSAKSVFVTGSFNSWKAVEYRLDKGEGGMWEATVLLAPGRYEYKFIVDTAWVCDPGNPIRVPVQLPFTGYNSFLEVRSSRDSLGDHR